MKTLKKNDKFKRVEDSSPQDYSDLNQLLKSGWNYCSKSEWKKATRKEVPKSKKKEGKKFKKN